MKKTYIFFIALFNTLNLISLFKKDESQKSNYIFTELSSSIPKELSVIIEQYKKSIEQRNMPNRLILHGPAGNGKTTLCEKIAEEINAKLTFIDTHLIIEANQGSGANKIAKIFKEAKQIIKDTKKTFVLIFDEIDCLHSVHVAPDNIERKNAIAKLWSELDAVENDKNFLIIFTTTKLSDLSKPLLNRLENNAIEISNPNNLKRKEIIEFLDKNLELKLDKNIVNDLVNKTDNMSIREIKNILTASKHKAVNFHDGVVTKKIYTPLIQQQIEITRPDKKIIKIKSSILKVGLISFMVVYSLLQTKESPICLNYTNSIYSSNPLVVEEKCVRIKLKTVTP